MSTPDPSPSPAVGIRPLPAGVLTLTVTKFRAIGAITQLEAKLSDWNGFHMPGGQPLPAPTPTLTIDGASFTVSSRYPVRLTFNLPDPQYLLIGIAWESTSGDHSVGAETFPSVLVRRGATLPEPYAAPVAGGSCMTITDNANLPGTFEYVVLIQETATGEIGILDPGSTNQPP